MAQATRKEALHSNIGSSSRSNLVYEHPIWTGDASVLRMPFLVTKYAYPCVDIAHRNQSGFATRTWRVSRDDVYHDVRVFDRLFQW